MEFKDVLKKLRKERGLSQTELASKLGVSYSLIGMYETGNRKPSYEMLEAIGDYFNVSTDYLQGRETGSEYYMAPEVAELAQQLKDRPELKVLFDASKDITKEDIQFVIDMIERMK